MDQLSGNESPVNSITGEEPVFSNSRSPAAPLIDILDDLPNQNPRPEDSTIVDQLGGLLSPLARFGNLFERVYARPTTSRLLYALGLSQPVAQYLETPMTLALLVTSLFFSVAILSVALKEVLPFSAALLAYSLKRSSILSLRILRVTFQSILIFASLSAVAAIGKAILGFPVPNISSGIPSTEQLFAHASRSREKIQTLRTQSPSVVLRHIAERLSEWKAYAGGTAVSLAAQFAEQKLRVKLVIIGFAYVILGPLVGDVFRVLTIKVVILVTSLWPIFKVIRWYRRRGASPGRSSR
ncbi:hypothetical protein BKA70DRAFT_1301720 [Coprinopsis sp. MPI-PUGE-AT-0042]|nr:hypothetical protein BKA70DRAFT_1326026 [Coprinopsis sp. MPI-PUGE-AT-0042]KAH6903156.1 hypothetical protein BKA70DRAFT_1301720 [Coprinopsis sp. MPI-PUGE-AT-0042]